jgi:hypothetical protein
MSKYWIYSENLERLEKKIKTIENKCSKYGLHFSYEITGEEFRTVKDEDSEEISTKFIEIDVEGKMQFEGWDFIAKVDHYPEGNIVRQFDTEIKVPERYYHTESYCEHCNTKRRRNYTYLVHNHDTDEWKQVGASCLKEFTFGLDAEDVAKYISLYDYIIEGEAPYAGVHFDPRYNLEDVLTYAKAVVDKLGYISASDAEYEPDVHSTRETVSDFYSVRGLGRKFIGYEKIEERMQELEFDPEKPEYRQYAKDAIKYIRSVEDTSGFMFNLKVACSEEYFLVKNLGFVVSLVPTYYRHLKQLEYEEKKKNRPESKSQHQGRIGERITFTIASAECVASMETMYGTSFLYKFTDKDENVYMWSTGKILGLTETNIFDVTGTVKSHSEYNGVPQTYLTRCKLSRPLVKQ